MKKKHLFLDGKVPVTVLVHRIVGSKKNNPFAGENNPLARKGNSLNQKANPFARKGSPLNRKANPFAGEVEGVLSDDWTDDNPLLQSAAGKKRGKLRVRRICRITILKDPKESSQKAPTAEKAAKATISSQQQLWKELRSDEQRTILASEMRHLKHTAQHELCLALVAYLRFGIVRTFADRWLNERLKDLIAYLHVEKLMGHLPRKQETELRNEGSGCNETVGDHRNLSDNKRSGSQSNAVNKPSKQKGGEAK